MNTLTNPDIYRDKTVSVVPLIALGLFVWITFRDSIFLYKNEVWKYGITINGEVGRYGTQLNTKHLTYVRQYTGRIEQCLIEERKKIITYPLLEENLKRKQPIAT